MSLKHTKNIYLIRFKFIEAMLLEYGEFKRCHIERCFNIASAAASKIVTEYNKQSGNKIVKGKAIGNFEPKYLDVAPRKFLEAAQIMALEQIIQYEKVLK